MLRPWFRETKENLEKNMKYLLIIIKILVHSRSIQDSETLENTQKISQQHIPNERLIAAPHSNEPK